LGVNAIEIFIARLQDKSEPVCSSPTPLY
jgi:hypothetical protein